MNNQLFLITQHNIRSFGDVSVFVIDMDNADLLRFFTAGTRTPIFEDTWVIEVEHDRLLINIGGGHMILLDAGLAMEAVLR